MDTLARHRISHGDTKLTNFIVAGDGPVITDLDSMRVHWLPVRAVKEASKDITRFLQHINTNDISVEIRRFCAAVFGYDGELPYRFTGDYYTIKRTSWSFLVRRGFNSEDAAAIVDGGIRQDDKRYVRVNSSKMTRVWTTTAKYRDKTIDVYIKLHLHRSVIDFIKHLFRDSRARRAFKASIMLRRNGLDCPEPLALLEKYWGPFRSGLFAALRVCTGSILVTEGIPDCVQLHTHINRLAAEGTQGAETERRTIVRELGAYVGKMHRDGIFHGDLRTGNILLQNDAGQWRFYLIDNERTRQFTVVPRRPLRGRLAVKNLVQLNMFQTLILNTDRMRFLKTYNEQMKLTDDEIHRLCKCVVSKTSKRLKIRKLHHSS
jgi:tRNA A-37 threonylcarbamoyl transferase component Bud32